MVGEFLIFFVVMIIFFFSLKCLYVECHLDFKICSNFILKMNRAISHLSFLRTFEFWIFVSSQSLCQNHSASGSLPGGFPDDPLPGSLSGLWTLQSYMEPRYGRWVMEKKQAVVGSNIISVEYSDICIGTICSMYVHVCSFQMCSIRLLF